MSFTTSSPPGCVSLFVKSIQVFENGDHGKQTSLPYFADGGYTGKYRQGFEYTDPTLQVKISRADMADSMIRQLLSRRNNRQVLPVSY